MRRHINSFISFFSYFRIPFSRITYIVFLILLFWFCFCLSPKQNTSKVIDSQTKEVQKTKDQCPFPVFLGTMYGDGISNFDKTFILFEIKQLLLDLCEGHFQHLLSFVHRETGLFVDAKGYWTTEEVRLDLIDPNGYFSLYYFDQTKLNQKKGSDGNLTILDVFKQAGPVYADFYVGSKEEVEVKFRFPEKPKLERYLINPSFIKKQNNWYLHRMF
ncbi:hypothetical protein EHQ10_10090 [Leptospira bouyouniensis]|uniref:Lipoprotein n=1 Tax=Leptospira bouyouniensis TaxID=2484911 RepID=A0ABY2L599_9LEPT|nr:hypothetical protein EHQ10_10090 [Leptospira bouyouniensis]